MEHTNNVRIRITTLLCAIFGERERERVVAFVSVGLWERLRAENEGWSIYRKAPSRPCTNLLSTDRWIGFTTTRKIDGRDCFAGYKRMVFVRWGFCEGVGAGRGNFKVMLDH